MFKLRGLIYTMLILISNFITVYVCPKYIKKDGLFHKMNDSNAHIAGVMDVSMFSEWLGLQTASSKSCLNKQLNEWTYNTQKLLHLSAKCKRFKMAFELDPTLFGQCHELFKEMAKIETQLNLLTDSESPLEKESYNEILFMKPVLQPLNFIPFFLPIWAIIRVYILPGLSLLFPILILIAPYIVLSYVFHIPITFTNYMNLLHSMVSGNVQSMMDPNAAAKLQVVQISPVAFLKQFGVVIATCVQGIIQPYWTYKHLNSIDTIIQDNGKLVIRCREIYATLEALLLTHGFTMLACPLPDFSNERDAVARIMLESSYFKMTLKYIGSLEVIMSLAHQKGIYPVQWITSNTPVFVLNDTFDFHVPGTIQQNPTSVAFYKKQHALLTGPNKGGKSTVLRSLACSALLAHTYGCSFGKSTMTPFRKLCVCLKPDDLPGTKSRFEREIEFTANTLNELGPILVFIDELYHSTNPPDALRSCQIYTDQLWKSPNVVSVISTHLFELVEQSNKNIQRLCVPAYLDNEGNVQFMHVLHRGICKISSVDLLLKTNGLLKQTRAPKQTVKKPLSRQNVRP